jgi:transcriptional regulator with XRE-family HTH domain
MTACYGINAREIARRCGVDIATARRWKRGASQMPKAAQMILSGDLGHFDPAWAGWTLGDGKLISPEGIRAVPTDVLAMPFVQAQLAVYQAENRRIKGMDEQPDSAVAADILGRLSAG